MWGGGGGEWRERQERRTGLRAVLQVAVNAVDIYQIHPARGEGTRGAERLAVEEGG